MLIEAKVIGSIIGDVQLTITIHHREVTTAIQSTYMFCSDGNKVSVIDIVERCRHVAEYRRSVGIRLITAGRNVTTTKHGIVNNDTTIDLVVTLSFLCNELLPFVRPLLHTSCRYCSLLAQRIQVISGHIVISAIGLIVITN